MVFNTGKRHLPLSLTGSDSSWAASNLTHTYFRNFQLFAGTSPSDLQGSQVKNTAQGRLLTSLTGLLVTACSVLLGLLIW
jgi:hypothetical protein